MAHNLAVLSGLFGRIARGARAWIVTPPFVGAAYVTCLVAWPATDAGGMTSREVVEVLVTRLSTEPARMRIGVVATAIALGAVLGLVAELLLWLRRSGARRARRSPLAVIAEAALVVAALHAALVGWSMAQSPQLYAADWYAKGGLCRTVQVIATDVLRPRGVALASLALAALYIWPTRRRLRRAVLLVRRSLRAAAAHVTKRGIAALVAVALAAAIADAPVRDARASRAPEPAEIVATPTREAAPNVLILSVDALRADRLDPRVTPNMLKLAARGTRFDRAYVSVPRAFPSWVSILTGRHSHHHGVRSAFPTREQRGEALDALPARFAEAGYATTVISDRAGDVFGQLDLGFARVDAPSLDLRRMLQRTLLERETALLPVLHSRIGRRLFPAMRAPGGVTDPMSLARDAEARMASMPRQPFFTVVALSAARAPYAAPAPYYDQYTDKAYRGRFKYQPTGLDGADVAPDAEDIRQLRALYDGAAMAVDAAIGRVLAALDRLHLADRTIVVVTAGHGETLFDDGRGQGHGDHLFGDEGTHVPLIVYDPRFDGGGERERMGRREGSVVRDVDLAPTLYELAGVAPPSDLDGRSLAPALRGESLDAQLAFAETGVWLTEEIVGLPPEQRIPYPTITHLTTLDARGAPELVLRDEMRPVTLMARHRMVRDERWKLVYVPTRSGARYFLFDTEADPSELYDVAAQHPEELERLRGELWSWMTRDPAMERKDGLLVPRGVR